MLFKKIYLVDQDNEPEHSLDIDRRYLGDYQTLKKEHPTLSTFYKDLMTNNLPDGRSNSNVILLIVRREDVNHFMQDYCNYLGLDYNAYKLIMKHSKFCTKYIDNLGDVISLDKEFSIINEDDYIYKPKGIKKDYEYFPAEYAINCIDQDWARKKFNHLRLWDLYMLIKEWQVIWYRCGFEVPDIINRFHMNHTSFKLLFDAEFEYEVLGSLFKMGLYEGCFSSDISDYLSTNPDFGYDKHTAFKYNKPLANYFKKVGYKINE